MRRTSPVRVHLTVTRRTAPEPLPVADEPLPVVWDELACCEALGISGTTLSEWRHDGLPYFRRGRVVRYVPADVLAWMRSHYLDDARRRSA